MVLNLKAQSFGNKTLLAIYSGLIFAYLFSWAQVFIQGEEWRADFTIFYTAAHILSAEQGAALYDLDTQTHFQQQILQDKKFKDGLLPFNYPPILALLLEPIAELDLKAAYLLWSLGQLVALFYLSHLIARLTKNWHPFSSALFILIVLSSNFLLINLMLGGVGVYLVIFFIHFYTALKMRRYISAGVFLMLISIKPQYCLFPLMLLMGVIDRRSVGWLSLIFAAFLFCPMLILDSGIWVDYFRLILKCASYFDQYGIHPSKMLNFKAIVTCLGQDFINSSTINFISFIVLFCALIYIFVLYRQDIVKYSGRLFELIIGLCFSLSVFLSPHSYQQDAILLLLPVYILINEGFVDCKANSILRYLVLSCPAILSILSFYFDTSQLGVQPAIFLPLALVCLYCYFLYRKSILTPEGAHSAPIKID